MKLGSMLYMTGRRIGDIIFHLALRVSKTPHIHGGEIIVLHSFWSGIYQSFVSHYNAVAFRYHEPDFQSMKRLMMDKHRALVKSEAKLRKTTEKLIAAQKELSALKRNNKLPTHGDQT